MSPTKEQIQKTRAQQEADIVQCLKTLSNGGLILYPTDTVWGIGCDATNAEAVKPTTSTTMSSMCRRSPAN